jgi:dienelactone hydrolase
MISSLLPTRLIGWDSCDRRQGNLEIVGQDGEKLSVVWILLISIGVILVVILGLPSLLITRTEFPQPSGKYAVGTTDLNWDAPDRSSADIIAKVWYPTEDRGGKNSPYIGEIGGKFANSIAVNLSYKLIFWLFRHITSPASINATPVSHSDGLPIILFSPGFGGINYLYTAYALEFASHGFITIGINHPKLNAGTMRADGSQIGLENFDMTIFDEPSKLERYTGNLTRSQAQNISAIIDRVIQLNSSPESLFYRTIDPSRIFAAGHSIGGSAAFVVCGRDPRVLKAVDIDGIFVDLDIADADYTGKSLLLIKSDRDRAKPKNKKGLHQYNAIVSLGDLWLEKLALKTDFQRQEIAGSTHNNFSDLSILVKPSIGKKLGLLGEIDGLALISQTSRTTIDFFDRS